MLGGPKRLAGFMVCLGFACAAELGDLTPQESDDDDDDVGALDAGAVGGSADEVTAKVERSMEAAVIASQAVPRVLERLFQSADVRSFLEGCFALCDEAGLDVGDPPQCLDVVWDDGVALDYDRDDGDDDGCDNDGFEGAILLEPGSDEDEFAVTFGGDCPFVGEGVVISGTLLVERNEAFSYTLLTDQASPLQVLASGSTTSVMLDVDALMDEDYVLYMWGEGSASTGDVLSTTNLDFAIGDDSADGTPGEGALTWYYADGNTCKCPDSGALAATFEYEVSAMVIDLDNFESDTVDNFASLEVPFADALSLDATLTLDWAGGEPGSCSTLGYRAETEEVIFEVSQGDLLDALARSCLVQDMSDTQCENTETNITTHFPDGVEVTLSAPVLADGAYSALRGLVPSYLCSE